MKKVISVVLCIVLILSLFSVTVVATGESAAALLGVDRPFALYDAAEGGDLIKPDNDGNYTVVYTPGQETKFHFLGCSCGKGSGVWADGLSSSSNDNGCIVTVNSGMSGTVVADGAIVNNGNIYTFTMTFVPDDSGNVSTERPYALYHSEIVEDEDGIYTSVRGEEVKPNEDGVYVVTIPKGQRKYVSFYTLDADTTFINCSGGAYTDEDRGYVVNSREVCEKTVTLKLSNGFTQTEVILFTTDGSSGSQDAPFAAYRVESASGQGEITTVRGPEITPENGKYCIKFEESNTKRICFYTINADTIFVEGCSGGAYTDGGRGYMVGPDNGAGEYNVTLKLNKGGQYNVKVAFIDDSQGPNPGTKLYDERDFVPGIKNDEYPGSYPSIPHFVAAVYACTIDGVDYYMAPVMWGGSTASQIYPGGNYDTDPALDPGSYEYRIYGIGFFTWHGGDEYIWVKDENTLSAIQDCFVEDSLTLNMKGMLIDDRFPDCYPAVYNPGNQVQTLLDAKGYMFGFPQKGQWIFTASGIRKKDNVTVTSKMYFEFKPMKRVFWEADPNSSDDIITQINNYLLTVTPDSDAWLIINLPAGDLYGYINVPKRLENMIVNITGEKNNSVNQTRLHGGIISNNYLTLIRSIDFVGAGKDTEKDSQNINNYAVSGTSGGNARECTFKEYYHAVHLEDGMITSSQNTFTDNHTAIYFNITTDRGGDQDWQHNLFERNDVAIHFVSLSENLAMTWYYFSNSWFIDNKTDIHNDMKRNIYMPRCYFEHDGDVWDGFDHRRLQGRVFVYPTSKDKNFTDFFYARRNGKAGTADMEQGHIGAYDYSAFKGTLNIYSGDQLHHSWTTK